ncbi:MAG TPA: hypothetical protein VEL31_20535 [Ktedonobacteraceae bacterium]|nr:hypothetical protein [Ktedonobacteraceae bacterium]
MAEMGLVPYTFKGITEYPRSQQIPAIPGQAQGVYITLASTDFQFILNKIIGWFRDRDEVELVDHGVSDKQGLGYIILEWTECEVDQLFCDILRDEEIVADYTVYTRDL